jgi:lycopene beta-cyclase
VRGAVRAVAPGGVTLEDGTSRRARLVIDARGPLFAPGAAPRAYQKFLGLELQLGAPSAPEVPLLMDATVEQLDGFRFLYLLPLAPDRVLLEDTYYSEQAGLDRALLRRRVLEYARHAGLEVRATLREEYGVLPLPTRAALPAAGCGLIRAGYAGGLFHPTTGYSLPVALRFALYLAGISPAEATGQRHAEWLEQHARQVRYAVLLNRLLFDAFAPEQRRHVLERFYRLPEPTIVRFYALQTTRLDRGRILCGRPPSGFSLPRLLSGGTHP